MYLCKFAFYTNKKSEADKTDELIKNSLSKNITDTNTAVDTQLSNHPFASASKPQHSSAMQYFIGDVEQPTKKQKLGSKKVEETIMGNELSYLHKNVWLKIF